MTKYMKSGNCYMAAPENSVQIFNKLPVGTYTIKVTEMGDYVIEEIDNYALGKIYGDVPTKAQRIFNTYVSREHSTGVLLSGEKGTGKTMLAKHISIEARKQSIPTIIINQPLHGEAFNRFIQTIDQECVIIFDEYEKVYRLQDQQNALLTLLDGVYPTHKLFILTTNDRYAVSQHMINRPGRLFYSLEYKGLKEDFVREYCEDVLLNKAHSEGVVQISQIFANFNFDMLKAMVEEMNRYNETAAQAITMMNIQPDDASALFDVAVEVGGKKAHSIENERMKVNPLIEFGLTYYLTAANAEKDKGAWVRVDSKHLVSIKGGTYTYEIPEKKLKVTLTRAKEDNKFSISDRMGGAY